MEEYISTRTAGEAKTKMITFGGGGLLVFIELCRFLMPDSSAAPQNLALQQQIRHSQPAEVRVNYNPKISWFEKNFCTGYAKTPFCD